jgi:heptosyltransferase-2
VVDYYLELAYYLGCPLESYRLELATRPEDERAADRFWRSCRLQRYPLVVVLNPGAAYGDAKCWPAGYFAQLARMFAQRCRAGLIVLCGPNETTLARQIVEQASHSAVFTVADFGPSIGLSKACVRRADLLVTTDSGPRHFAAAFDVPVVTIFGPTHQAWSETYFAKAIHLQRSVDCGPCQLKRCPTDHRCMRELKPEEVFQAARQAIERFGRRSKPATG